MKHDEDKREPATAAPARNSRQDRLRLALRENLKRRKSQAKERDKLTAAPSAGADGVGETGPKPRT
jgi:hypothetical protein